MLTSYASYRYPHHTFTNGMFDLFIIYLTRSLLTILAMYISYRCYTNQSRAGNVGFIGEKLPIMDDSIPDPRREWERNWYNGQHQLKIKRTTLLAISFLICTSSSVYAAVKTVRFSYPSNPSLSEKFTFSILGLTVLFSNLAFYFAKKFVTQASTEIGKIIPSVHNHPMHYSPSLNGHWCDVCHSRISAEGYRCKQCDFDSCLSCWDRAMAKHSALSPEERRALNQKSKELTNYDYFMRAMSFGKPHWRLFTASALALLASTIASLAMPSFTGKILDAVYRQDKDDFETNVSRMVISSGVVSILSLIRYTCISIAGRRIAAQVRVTLFSAILGQSIEFFDGQMSGQLTSRMTNDVSGMVSPWSTILNVILGNSLTLIGGLIMCLVTSWKLSALALASIGPIVFLTNVYARWSRSINKEIYSALGDANTVATEALGNIRTIRAFSTERVETDKYQSAVERALSKSVKDALASSGTSALTSFIDLMTSALILGFGGWQAINHPDELSAGDLLRFQLYLSMTDSSWQSLNGILNSLTISAAAASRVLGLLDSLPSVDLDSGIVVDKLDSPPELELRNVAFAYPTRKSSLVLKDISFICERGTVTALVGPSGGGKSSCIALMMRLYDPQSGQIFFNGQDLRTLNLRSVHQHVGLVAQETQLFGTTVLANIMYSCPPHSVTREDVIEAARKANIYDEIMEFEEGFQTKIGERGVRLSGGQRQRIALARVFLRKPKLLLLDEATSSLDALNESLVQKAIDSLLTDIGGKVQDEEQAPQQHGKVTCVIVAHRLSTVVGANKIIVISKGSVVETGTHDELLAKGDAGLYASLVKTQLVSSSTLAAAAGGSQNNNSGKSDESEMDDE
jgi:ABC-type multidrug transport system fused ATPase/permease subunit